MKHLLTENLVALAEAGRHIPPNPHPNTMRRWASEGIDGILLETVRIGGRKFTSLEALSRFLERLNGPTS